MNWILKNKNKNHKTQFVVLFLMLFLLSFNVKNTLAADPPVTIGRGSVQNPNQLPSGSTSATAATPGATGHTVDGAAVNNTYVEGTNPTKNKAGVPNSGTCLGVDLECYFKMMLIGVFNLVAWLAAIAATLFNWVIKPENISGPGGILNKQAVKDVWIMVRDTLNMTFILILLFAAFCTIFQIEKWNLKKVWLGILINALLVNFSYPIARFFIDVSNVAFYYFVNHLFTSSGTVSGSSIMASFGAISNLGELVTPKNYSAFPVSYILAMTIVTFILGMTFLVIAALFVVRLTMLTILVMFSPIGFVGYIFPATEEYANKWWQQLFSYSFFAPIMIFIMAISLRIIEAMGKENFQSFLSGASANADANNASWIANAAFFVIPIIIMWIGMGYAKSAGIAGANLVTDGAQKFSKSMGMKFSGANWTKKRIDAYSAERKKRADEKFKGNLGATFGKKVNKAQDFVHGKAPFIPGSKSARKRYDKMILDENREDIDKDAKKLNDSGATVSELHNKLSDAFLHPPMSDKDWKEQAAHAKAYLAKQGDDRKMHIQTNLADYNALVDTDPAHHFAKMTQPQRDEYITARGHAQTARDAIVTARIGNPNANVEAHVKVIASFANRAAEESLKHGVNIGTRPE